VGKKKRFATLSVLSYGGVSGEGKREKISEGAQHHGNKRLPEAMKTTLGGSKGGTDERTGD